MRYRPYQLKDRQPGDPPTAFITTGDGMYCRISWLLLDTVTATLLGLRVMVFPDDPDDTECVSLPDAERYVSLMMTVDPAGAVWPLMLGVLRRMMATTVTNN